MILDCDSPNKGSIISRNPDLISCLATAAGIPLRGLVHACYFADPGTHNSDDAQRHPNRPSTSIVP